jgi:hypothetical protein
LERIDSFRDAGEDGVGGWADEDGWVLARGPDDADFFGGFMGWRTSLVGGTMPV